MRTRLTARTARRNAVRTRCILAHGIGWGLMQPCIAGRGWSKSYGIAAEPQLDPVSQPAEQEPLASTLNAKQQPISGSAEQQPIALW